MSDGAAILSQARPRRALAAPLARRIVDTAPAFDGERFFARWIKAIPILWLLGLLAPAAVVATLRLLYARWPRDPAVNLVVAAWILVGLAQAFSAFLNGVAIGSTSRAISSLFGFGVTGWVFGGLALAAGAAHRLDSRLAIRAITWIGAFVLVLLVIGSLARLAGVANLRLPFTPMSLILPESPAVGFYTSVAIYQQESTFGELTTRFILFFPWTTGLGLGALAIAFVSLLEVDWRYRLLGLAGGVAGVVFSWSRVALLCLVLGIALVAFLRAPLWLKLAAGLAGALLLFLMPQLGADPAGFVASLGDSIANARAGSSQARELIYARSFEGFLQSPIIGHGWIGPSVHRTEILPIGSHSTIFGLLYTGGLVTFLPFVLAMTLTGATLVFRYILSPYADRLPALIAVTLFGCLVLYSTVEALFNLTMPCFFLFTFLGSRLVSPTRRPAEQIDSP